MPAHAICLHLPCCSVTVVPIKGDVEGIERTGGRTEVLVTEGLNTVSYALDEALVTFDTALKERVRGHAHTDDVLCRGMLPGFWHIQS
jgi:hypothetical protein